MRHTHTCARYRARQNRDKNSRERRHNCHFFFLNLLISYKKTRQGFHTHDLHTRADYDERRTLTPAEYIHRTINPSINQQSRHSRPRSDGEGVVVFNGGHDGGDELQEDEEIVLHAWFSSRLSHRAESSIFVQWYSFVRSFVQWYSFIRPFVQSHSFIHSFIRSPIRSFDFKGQLRYTRRGFFLFLFLFSYTCTVRRRW